MQPTAIALGTTKGATDLLDLGYTYGDGTNHELKEQVNTTKINSTTEQVLDETAKEGSIPLLSNGPFQVSIPRARFAGLLTRLARVSSSPALIRSLRG
jgi:hypothetical protein